MAKQTAQTELRKRLIYVSSVDRVWDGQTRRFLELGAAARRFSQEYGGVGDAYAKMMDGEFALRKADALTFWPGKPIFFRDGNVAYLNLWREREFAPARGDAAPFIEHINLLCDGEEVPREYLLDRFAHLIQAPACRTASALLIIGGQGVGKSILGNFLAELVGRHNASFVDARMLRSDFTGWMSETSLAIVHEMTMAGTQGAQLAATLKHLITSERIFVNPKGMAQFQIENRMNFVLFSNEADAAKLDPDDRRYFVWHSRATKQPPAYYTNLCNWFDGEGKRYVLQALLDRDISRFNPFDAPPQTRARENMIRESMDERDRYLLDAFEAFDVPFDIDLCVTNDIVDYFSDHFELRVNAKQVTVFLRDHLRAHALGQRRLLGEGGVTRKPRMWAVRNVERWARASESEIALAYRRPGAPSGRQPEAPPLSITAQPSRRIAGSTNSTGTREGNGSEDFAVSPTLTSLDEPNVGAPAGRLGKTAGAPTNKQSELPRRPGSLARRG